MKCPTCGNDLRQSTKDPNYALCDTCHKKYKLPSSLPGKNALPKRTLKRPAETGTQDPSGGITGDSQAYSNIPPEHVRTKKEREMKKNYDAMLSAGKEDEPRRVKASKRGTASGKPSSDDSSFIKTSAKSAPPKRNSQSRKRPSSRGRSRKKEAPFKTGRLVVGILSIVLFAFITFQSCAAGLGNILSSSSESSGTAGVILSVCFLVGGILSIALRNKENGIGFFAPAVFYIIGSYVAGANVGTYKDLMIWSVLAAVIGAGYLLLLFLCAGIHKIAAIAIPVVILAIAIALCVFGSMKDTKKSESKKSGKTVSSESKDKKKSDNKDNGTLNFKTDAFTVKYDKHELSKDADGKDCLLVYYNFKNNGEGEISAAASIVLTASQNGEQLQAAVIDKANESINNYLLNVASDKTVNVCQAFSLADQSDVTLDVTEFVSIDGKNDTQVIKLSE